MEVLRMHEDCALYYLTFSVVQWLPVFVSEAPCLIIIDSLNFCHREKGLRINAFVIMPTHVHLIVTDADFNVERLRQTIADMRKYTGRQLSKYCEHNMPPVFRQAIGGPVRADRTHQFWQQSRHPEAIFTYSFWQTKSNYLHDNPRRKGLVRESVAWRFSSAGYWLSEPPGESDVVLTAIEW
ncbi:MAG: REP-associated tyrosine transposase [Anaerolineae bacterium]